MTDGEPKMTDPEAGENKVPGEEAAPEKEDVAVGLAGSVPLKRASRKGGIVSLTSIAVGAALLGGVGITAYKIWNRDELNTSRISRAPVVNTTPAGEQLAESERYKNSLNAANQANSQSASQEGGSFVATPDEPLRDVDLPKAAAAPGFKRPVAPPNDQPEQPPVANLTPDQRETRKGPDDYSDINQLAAAMSSQGQGLLQSWKPTGSTNTIILQRALYKSPEQKKAEAEAAERERKATQGNMGEPELGYAISAGQMTFARTVNASDSDTPGPVIAEILKKGPLYKARLIGAFEQNRTTNALIVQFDRIVMPDGTEQQTSAYAIDGTKGTIAVKSDVDHRLLARYGPLIASTFIQGLGEAMSITQQDVIYSDNTTQVVQKQPNFEEGLYAGAGRVGDALARDIERAAPKGPLVKMRAGMTIGVLFMQGVPNLAPSMVENQYE